MTRTVFHTLAAALVIGLSVTLAFALETSISWLPEVNSTRPVAQITYAWKVKGGDARGKERLYVVDGGGFLGDFGASCFGSAAPRRNETAAFDFSVFAPIGTGRNTNSTLTCRYDTRRDKTDEAALNLEESAYTFQEFDDGIAGRNRFIKRLNKRPAVTIDGLLVVQRMKSKARIRSRRDSFRGALSVQAQGIVTSGANADRRFKAKIKMKFRNARRQALFAGVRGSETIQIGK